MMEDNEPNLFPTNPWQEPGQVGRSLNRPAEPPPGQWEAIEARMKGKRRRRGFLWLWMLALLVGSGLAWYGHDRMEATRARKTIAHQAPKLDGQAFGHAQASLKSEQQQAVSEQNPELKKKTSSPIKASEEKRSETAELSLLENQPGLASKSSTKGKLDGATATGGRIPVAGSSRTKQRRSQETQTTTETQPGQALANHAKLSRSVQKSNLTNEDGSKYKEDGTGVEDFSEVSRPRLAKSNTPQTGEGTIVQSDLAPSKPSSSVDQYSDTTPQQSQAELHSNAINAKTDLAATKDLQEASNRDDMPQSTRTQDSANLDSLVKPIHPDSLVATPVNPPDSANPQERRLSSLYFGLSGLSYTSQTRVQANGEQEPVQYRVAQLGSSWGGLATAGHHLLLSRKWSLTGELNVGLLARQGRYRVQPGGGAAFSHTALPDSLGFAALPTPTAERAFHQTIGIAGVAIRMHYQAGILDVSAGARLFGYRPLNTGGTSGLSLQPMAGVALQLGRGLSIELTGQPFRIKQEALPLPLPSQSYGGLYSLGLIWLLE